MSCPDLCTAEKCAELERKIQDLESKLEEHLNQTIPTCDLNHKMAKRPRYASKAFRTRYASQLKQ